MADQVAILDDGRLRQFGPPERVYDAPDDRFVADFLGNPSMNQLRGVLRTGGGTGTGLAVTVDPDRTNEPGGPVELARLPPDADLTGVATGDVVQVGIRPEHLRVEPSSATDGGGRTDTGGETAGRPRSGWGRAEATVQVTEYQGNDNFVHLEVAGHAVTAVVPPSVDPDPGETVAVAVPPEAVHLFDVETGETLFSRTVPPDRVA